MTNIYLLPSSDKGDTGKLEKSRKTYKYRSRFPELGDKGEKKVQKCIFMSNIGVFTIFFVFLINSIVSSF